MEVFLRFSVGFPRSFPWFLETRVVFISFSGSIVALFADLIVVLFSGLVVHIRF